MNKKHTHGGPRQNAGRPPVTDKKVTFGIQVRESWIEKLGREKVREIAERAVERAAKK